MRLHIFTIMAALTLTPIAAQADGYVMGAGRWTCGDLVRIADQGTQLEKAQVFSWIMGFWSAATFERETRFVDIVENAGGKGIASATVNECRNAPPETVLYRVSQEMIRNTK